MLIYLLLIGSIGGWVFWLYLLYRVILRSVKGRKIKSKKEFAEEVKKYESKHT